MEKSANTVRVEAGLLTTGQALPFDLFDNHHRLLLKRGYTIQSQEQLDRLIERGVFFEKEIIAKSQERNLVEWLSIYLRMGELSYDFECLFDQTVPNYNEALSIAERIRKLCELDTDAALGSIHHQKSKRYSLRHSFHTAVMTEILLKHLNLPEENRCNAVAGALTMNIAMLELQDILYSQKMSLSLEQKRTLVSHPLEAINVLRKHGIKHPVWIEVIEHHHEMIDGSGYPKRLQVSELSIESQALSLADRYCAMISERGYRTGHLPDAAAKDLINSQTATIAPSLKSAFLREVGIYPPGTVVSLSNGELAVAIRRLQNPKQPLVRSLLSPMGIRYPDPPKRLTSKPAYAINEVLSADKVKEFDLTILWHPIQLDMINDEDANAG